jgi:hypothetical protein
MQSLVFKTNGTLRIHSVKRSIATVKHPSSQLVTYNLQYKDIVRKKTNKTENRIKNNDPLHILI